jgi:hypothetical protein
MRYTSIKYGDTEYEVEAVMWGKMEMFEEIIKYLVAIGEIEIAITMREVFKDI